MKENTVDELEQLHKQISELQSKAQDLAEKKKELIIKDIKSKIKMFGITAKELGFLTSTTSTEKKSRKAPVAIKYRHGENTWTGRGKRPLWIASYLAKGGKIEELLVKV
ncbi:MAG: H-NS family nucleoid-associated regulatory protein [Polaromonas sp.]|jgi:DNA-binding protein H-NS